MHIGCAIRDEDNEQENGVVVYTNGANGGDVPAREDKVQQVEGHAEESESSGEDELPELISEAAAISEYNVPVWIFASLPTTRAPDPEDPDGNEIDMYLRSDIIREREQIQELRDLHDRMEAEKQENAEALARQKKINAQQKKADCKSSVAGFKAFPDIPTDSIDSGLGVIWQVIVPHMGVAMSENKEKIVYDEVQEAVKVLSNLAQTCEEMNQLVLETALPNMEERLDRSVWERFGVASDEDGKLPEYWNRIVRNPTSCKIPELKEALRQLKVPKSGTKDELIIRIYDLLGMKKLCPKPLPAGIVFALRFQGKWRPNTFYHQPLTRRTLWDWDAKLYYTFPKKPDDEAEGPDAT